MSRQRYFYINKSSMLMLEEPCELRDAFMDFPRIPIPFPFSFLLFRFISQRAIDCAMCPLTVPDCMANPSCASEYSFIASDQSPFTSFVCAIE
eukprot:m.79501 g.79501  ORF g.79501 m.79501 type:complete len:93 (+) comp8605_c3_seq1:79-357(+)